MKIRDVFKRKFNDRGQEIPDKTPVAIPVRLRGGRGDTLRDQVRRLLREELSMAAHNQGFETFQEADDFFVPDGDDDLDFVSNYEMSEMQEEAAFMAPDADPPPDPAPKPDDVPPPVDPPAPVEP